MSEEPEKLAEGTLISHLLELRDRLLRSLVAVGLAFVPVRVLLERPLHLLSRPLLAKLPQGSNLIATGVMSPFTTPFKLSFFAALMIAMPVRHLPAVGVRRAGPVPRRAALRGAAAGVLDRALLRRHRLRLLLRLPGDVRVLRQHHAQGRGDDDRHQQLPRLRRSPCSSASGSRSRCRWRWCCWCSWDWCASRSCRRTAATC